jgi:hypothetical protein
VAILDLFARTGACCFLRTAPDVLLVLPGESFRRDDEVSVIVPDIILQMSGMGEVEDRHIIIAWDCTPFSKLIYTNTNTRSMLH